MACFEDELAEVRNEIKVQFFGNMTIYSAMNEWTVDVNGSVNVIIRCFNVGNKVNFYQAIINVTIYFLYFLKNYL